MAEHPQGSWTADPSQRRLALVGTVSLGLYAALLIVSFAFRDENPPLLIALGLLGVATLVWWMGLWIVFAKPQAVSVGMIVGFSIAFRVLLLPSWPIQEIDFYRYLWDGQATLHGDNPYIYSPYQVEIAEQAASGPAELMGMVELSHRSESVRTIFDRVHYRDIPTAYPPLAQMTFAVSAAITPANAPVYVHILIWKALVVACDLATLVLLVVLLRRLNLPPAWCLAYGWCPLVMKEFANSGHFDALAVMLTVAAVLLLVNLAHSAAGVSDPGYSAGDSRPGYKLALAMLAGATLALAVLAKTYPVVLLPVVVAFLASVLRWRAMVAGMVFLVVLVVGYLPFAGRGETEPVSSAPSPTADLVTPHHPGAGLGTFLAQWEMNDFLFMLVRENVREPRPTVADPWLTLVPAGWRESLHRHGLIPVAAALDVSPKADLAILLTQIVMGGVLLVLSIRWSWQVYRRPEGETLARAVFLTLAWAWLLSAAQNPWYLMWSLPFMLFAGWKSWFLLPGLVLLYYYRFWVDRTGNLDAFDYGVVWLEYLPFFMALIWECCRTRTPEEQITLAIAGDRPREGEAPAEPRTASNSPARQEPRPPAERLPTLQPRFAACDSSAPVAGRRGMSILGVVITLLGIGAGLGLAVLIVHANRPRVLLEGPADLPRVPLQQVDHAAWDVLLQKYVDDEGLVAYAKWKASDADVKALDGYLARLGAVELLPPASPPAQLAYWINAYNALTIKGILREYPTSSIRNHTSPVAGYNLWRDLLLEIDGRPYSLDDIEHATLRPMGEPRIHFALVCAAKGCPPLRNRAWTAANLDESLTDSARRFFARPSNFRVDPVTRTVFVSELFDWYGTDFAPTAIEQIRMLRPYLPMAEQLFWLDDAKATVKHLDYDWRLNDQK